MMKKRFLLFVPLLASFASGCEQQTPKDIVLLYTTDVHCGIDTNIGYSGIASYRDQMIKEGNDVCLLDAGDYLQGAFSGVEKQGEYIVSLMNEVGYDVVTIGNHEFDYGMEVLSQRLSSLNSEIACANFHYVGKKKDQFTFLKPYTIKSLGAKRVGFVGLTTPSSMVENNPACFYEDGALAYDFEAKSSEAFYQFAQKSIDDCKAAGADYVFLLTHLGSDAAASPFSSLDVVAHTNGVTAVMDGHSHLDRNWVGAANKDGEMIPICDSGYQLNEFGKVTITTKGEIQYDFISAYEGRSEKVSAKVNEVNQTLNEVASKVVAHTDIALSTVDKDTGFRLARNREIGLADLDADAYRILGETDIGLNNGGGLRANLPEGDVTYGTIRNIHPFGNFLQAIKTKGSKIRDYLEFTTRFTEKESHNDKGPVGEFGGFPCVSGLKFEIDTSVPNSVETTTKGEFLKVNGPRRVKNILVLQKGEYVPLDDQKEYTISSNNFLFAGGDGVSMFKDDPKVETKALTDYQVLISYIADHLQGKLKEQYAEPQGRITIL